MRFRNSSQLFLAPTALGPHQHGRGGQGERDATLRGEGDVAGPRPSSTRTRASKATGPSISGSLTRRLCMAAWRATSRKAV